MKYRLNYKLAKELLTEKYGASGVMSYNEYRRSWGLYEMNAKQISEDFKQYFFDFQNMRCEEGNTSKEAFLSFLLDGDAGDVFGLYAEVLQSGYDCYMLIYYGA